MSRELLKRAVTLIKCLNGASWEHEIPQVVIQDIETYLNQPKPEPVLLSDDDISSICQHWVSIGVKEATMARFIRSLEAAVLRANGYDWLRLK